MCFDSNSSGMFAYTSSVCRFPFCSFTNLLSFGDLCLDSSANFLFGYHMAQVGGRCLLV